MHYAPRVLEQPPPWRASPLIDDNGEAVDRMSVFVANIVSAFPESEMRTLLKFEGKG